MLDKNKIANVKDTLNIKLYMKGIEDSYTCVLCGMENLSLSDTYSNRGHNLVCRGCVIGFSSNNIDREMEFLRMYVWSDKNIWERI